MKISSKSRPMSLAAQVTLAVGVAIFSCFIVLGFSVLGSVSQHFSEQDAEELKVVAHAVERAMTENGQAGKEALEVRLASAVAGHHGIYFGVINQHGQLIYSQPPLDLSPLLENAGIVTEIKAGQLFHWSTDRHEYRGAVIAPDALSRLAEGTSIAVAINMDFHHHFMSTFQYKLWGLMVAGGFLTIIAAWLAIGFGHRPLQRISEQIKTINTEQLSRRLDTQQAPSELKELAEAFNAMISHVEQSFEKLSQFSADIAHELRTPITNLSTQTQVALNKERSADEYRDILYSNLEEYNQLSAMIRDMLWLAQTDNRQLALHWRSVNLRDEIQLLHEYFELLAEEKHIKFFISVEKLFLNVDQMMFRRALSNLLSNAIKHSKPNSGITIGAKQLPEAVIIDIENTGDTISEDQLEKIFDRFYRIDPARTHQNTKEGVGLGLAITRAIIKLHGGTIAVTSKNGLTRFTVSMPTGNRVFS